MTVTRLKFETSPHETFIPAMHDIGVIFAREVNARALATLPRIVIGGDESHDATLALNALETGLHAGGCNTHRFSQAMPEDAVGTAIVSHVMDAGIYARVFAQGFVELSFNDEDARPFDVMAIWEKTKKPIYVPKPHDPCGKRFTLDHWKGHATFLARSLEAYGDWPQQKETFRIVCDNRIHSPVKVFVDALASRNVPDNVTVILQNADERTTIGERVLDKQADIGVQFTSDGNRVAVFDDRGDMIHPAHVGALLVGSTGARWPDGGVVSDHRCALAALWMAEACKVSLTTCAPGAVNIGDHMRETGAAFGCDPEGHYLFRELGWQMSGVFAALLMTHVAYLNEDGLSACMTKLREGHFAHGPRTYKEVSNPQVVVDAVASALLDPIRGLDAVAHERGEDGSLVMRSQITDHDWRVVVSPRLQGIDTVAEAYGGTHTRAMVMHVVEAVQAGIEAARLEGETS